MTSKFKIVERDRRGFVREAGTYTTWTEYQVWRGRKILARFDFRRLAEEYIAEREAKPEATP